MAIFEADQPRQFILDSSRQNATMPGRFQQDNNRYVLEVMLYDNSIPVPIPEGVDITVAVRSTKANSTVYVLDKNVPDFVDIVSYNPDTNIVKINKWAAMVEQYGQMMFAVTVGGVSTYTATYSVEENRMRGARVYHHQTPVDTLAKKDLSNVDTEAFSKKAKDAKMLTTDLAEVDMERFAAKVAVTSIGKQVEFNAKALEKVLNPEFMIQRNRKYWAVRDMLTNVFKGMSEDELVKMLETNRHEVMQAVNFAIKPFSDSKVLHISFVITSNDQIINQVLPPVSKEQILVFDIIRAKNVTGGKVVFSANTNDTIDGADTVIDVSDDGYIGYFVPMKDEMNYVFRSHNQTHPYNVTVVDKNGTAVSGVRGIVFDNAEIVSTSGGIVTMHVDVPDIDVVHNGIVVPNKKLVYDIDTGEFTVSDK